MHAVSNFIAYAMARGHVRLIARSNGSRYLLHLPPPFNRGDLATISSVITVSSPLVGLTFDVPQVALATVSIGATIMLWSIHQRSSTVAGSQAKVSHLRSTT